jgi:hypothetical protein
VQCERERQYNLVSEMMAMTVSPVQAVDRNSCHSPGATGYGGTLLGFADL